MIAISSLKWIRLRNKGESSCDMAPRVLLSIPAYGGMGERYHSLSAQEPLNHKKQTQLDRLRKGKPKVLGHSAFFLFVSHVLSFLKFSFITFPP